MRLRLRLAHVLGALAAVSAALVLTAAIAVGLFRFAASAVPNARGTIEAWAERRLALRLRLRTIDLVWRRLHPEFVLRGVRLLGPPGSATVAVRRLALGISWSALLAGRLRPSWIGLDGLSLPLVQGPDGRWRLPRGLAPLLAATSKRPARPFEGGIRLRDARFLLRSPVFGPAPLLVDALRFRLRAGDDRARLNLEAVVPDWGRARLRLSYDGRGEDPWEPWRKGTRWRASWDLEGLRAGTFLLALRPAWASLAPHGRLTGEGDLGGRGLVFDGKANLALARFRWQAPPGAAGSFALRFAAGVRSAEGRTAVDVSGLEIRPRRGKAPAPVALSFLLHPTAAGTKIRAEVPLLALSTLRLPIEAASAFAARAAPWLEDLARARPRGRLVHTRLVARWLGGRPVAWTLHGELLGFRSRSLGSVPGLSLPPVRLALGNAGGGILLGAGALGLADRRWGGEARVFTTPGFAVDYRRTPGGLRVTLPGLRARGPGGAFRLRAALRFPPKGPARIRLALEARRLSLPGVRAALPASLVGKGFSRWLFRAFPDGGDLLGLTILWHGPLAALPCVKKGCPVARARASLPRFVFARGWPALENVRVLLSYRKGLFGAVLRRGTMGGWRPAGARVFVGPAMKRARLNLVFSGPLAPAWRVFARTPLAASSGGLLRRLRIRSGDARGRLTTLVPFAHPRRTTLGGDLVLHGVDLGLGSKLATLTALAGRLVFVRGGVASPALSGRWLGAAFHASGTVAHGTEEIHAVGGLAVPVLVSDLSAGPSPPWIAGEARWTLAASVSPGRGGRIVWRSNLKGVRIGLHAPLGKTAPARLPLVLVAAREGLGRIHLRGRYGRLGRWFFRAPSARGPWSGAVVFGEGRPVLPAKGLAVEGRLPELDLRDLARLLRLGPRGRTPKPARSSAVFRIARLDVGRVVGYGQDFGPLVLRGRASPDRVDLALTSAAVAGTVLYRRSVRDPRGLVRLSFTRLDLALPHHPARPRRGLSDRKKVESGPVRPRAVARASAHPGIFPALDLTSDSTRLGRADLGRIVARFRPAPHAWILNRLEAHGPGYAFEANGYWARHAGGDRVRFLFTLTSPDVHTAFLAFGLTPLMTGKSALVRGNLGWHGVPWHLDRPTVSGVVSLEAHGGRVLPLNPGAGRLLGLLSLSSLPQRLGLDFSDVFDRGLAYNTIRGRFRITNGVATIPALVLHGPAVRLRLEGEADIVHETYDEVVRVVPLVSSTLPLAGALVGGPVGFAALLVLSRMFSLPMRTLLATYYHIGGTWTHPLVRRIGDEVAHRLGFRGSPAP